METNDLIDILAGRYGDFFEELKAINVVTSLGAKPRINIEGKWACTYEYPKYSWGEDAAHGGMRPVKTQGALTGIGNTPMEAMKDLYNKICGI